MIRGNVIKAGKVYIFSLGEYTVKERKHLSNGINGATLGAYW